MKIEILFVRHLGKEKREGKKKLKLFPCHGKGGGKGKEKEGSDW